MDPARAQRLFRAGALLLLLDVPPSFEVGIDGASWAVGPLFKGLKMVPPGLHFLYYRVLGRDGDAGALSGVFLFLAPGEVRAMRWTAATEEFVALGEEEAHTLAAPHALPDLDRHLGPFPVDGTEWPRFLRWTRHVTPELVARILPNRRAALSSMTGSYHGTMDLGRAAGAPRAAADLTVDDLHFTPISQTSLAARPAAADALTAQILDRTAYLDSLLQGPLAGDARSLLGELELAFVILVLGHNFEGFEQWRAIVCMLCQCPRKVASSPDLFCELIDTLRDQLGECPEDFFDAALVQDNRLVRWLTMLVDDCRSGPDLRLARKADELASFASDRFGWTLDAHALETGDDAPAIL